MNPATRQPTGLALRPFTATRYSDPERLEALTSPAYDLIEPAERAKLGAADPHSIVHLTLPTFGVEDAARRLALWRRDGVLRTDPTPALFVYEMAEVAGGSPTRGWIGAVVIPPGGPAGAPGDAAPPIVPHEATVAAVVADRLRLRVATGADLEPIVLAHDGEPGDADAIARLHVAGSPPIIDLVDGGGARHRVWRVDEPDQVAAVRSDMATRRAVIADGHHRYASATAHRDIRLRDGSAPGAADRILALLVPTGLHGPRVQAIHRVIPGLSLERAATGVADAFQVDPVGPLTEREANDLLEAAGDTLLLVTDSTDWLRFTRPQRRTLVAQAEWEDLDVALVDAGLIADRWDAAGSVLLRHAVGPAIETARQCDGIAVLLRPTRASTILDLAARGVLMPRKSTFFVPKPRTGLLMRCFADEPDG